MRIKSPLLINAAGRLGCYVVSALFATVKRDVWFEEAGPYNSTGKKRYIFSMWHDSSVLGAFSGRHNGTVALTSRHRDGSFVASILAPLGVETVRGSTGKGGLKAARQLMEIAKERDIAVVPDGPRGPRREMSKGIVYLASRTGNPIVPIVYACDKCWEIKSSWTSHTIPRPFSRVAAYAGPPFHVPPNLRSEGLQAYVSQVQHAMDESQAVVDRHMGIKVEAKGPSKAAA